MTQPLAPRTSTGDFSTDDVRIASWSAVETAGAAAEFTIRAGGASGTKVLRVKLAASESAGDSFPQLIDCDGGIHLTVDSGAVEVLVAVS